MYVLFLASLLKTSVKRAGLVVGEGGGWGRLVNIPCAAGRQMFFWEVVGLLPGTRGNKVNPHHFEKWLMALLPSLIGAYRQTGRNAQKSFESLGSLRNSKWELFADF